MTAQPEKESGWVKSMLWDPDEDKPSSTRVLLIAGGGMLVGLLVAVIAGIWLGQVTWELFAGPLEYAKDLYLYFTAPYIGKQVGKGIGRR